METEKTPLLGLAEAIADGRLVDWPEAEQTSDQTDRDVVKQLRLLSDLADVHRGSSPRSFGHHRPPDDRSGSTWGPLEIRDRVGGGSFGTVYHAWDPRLARDVALKLLHRETSEEEASVIINEGRLLARVRHPNVITVFGASRFDGRIGIWMDFIRGRTLENVLKEDGPFSAREASLVGSDLCRALAAVHAQGVVHRDIKAHNVMREEGGRVVLMDFGAGEVPSDVTPGGRLVGTPLCMAPELFGGNSATPAADLYSVGVLLFHLVSGSYPVVGTTMAEVRAAHARRERRHLRDLRPELPSAFVHAVDRALAPDPSARVESAGALELLLNESLRSDSAPLDASPTTEPRRIRPRALVALAAVALAAVGWWAVSSWRDAGVPQVRMIAMRPLKNLSGDPSLNYLAAGLSDVLMTKLGGISSLRIVAESAVDHESQARSPVSRTGPKVEAILDGSMQMQGGRILVAAKLIDVETGAVRWGKSYDGPESDAFDMQSRIAADIARDLKVSVTDVEARRLARQYVVSPQAQASYLRGRFLLDNPTRPNLEQARLEFERAVQLESQYAPAHAGLALTYMGLGNFGAIQPGDARALAEPAAETAFKIDPMLPEAALAAADVRFRLNWDWQGADEAYRTAINLNPSYMQARGQYARYLAAANRTSDALREALAAYQLDPLSAEIHSVVGLMLFYHRQYDDAIAHFSSRLDPRSVRGHTGLARSYAAARRYDQALASLATAYDLSGHDLAVRAEMGRTLADAGRTAEAREILNDLYARLANSKDYVFPSDLAYIHIALGEHDAAFRLLNQAIDDQASRLLWMAVDPRLNPVRSDPRFSVLASRLGIRTSH